MVEFGTEKYTAGLLSHAKIGSDQQMRWEVKIGVFWQFFNLQG